MKKIIKALLIIAVLNFLAVLAGAGWMFSSGRLSKDRVIEMTSLFSDPVVVEEARIKAEQTAIEKELAEQEKPLPELALNSEERNRVRVEMTQVDRQRLDRMNSEVKSLQLSLRKERQAVIDERVALDEEKKDFDMMRERLAELEGSEQFKKSLDTLSGMSPKESTKVVMALINESKDEEVLAYLSAMDSRTRTSILTQIVKSGDEQLAADLLESLRVHGLESTVAQREP